MSTNVVGVGATPAPGRLGHIVGVVVGIVLAISIGIGIAQNDRPSLTLDRFHPGHPTVAEDRQERVSELREADQFSGERQMDPIRASGPGR